MFPVNMSDQVTGHESGAKVGTAPVHPHDQMVSGVEGGVAMPKPLGPRHTMIGAFRMLMSGMKSLSDRPCPPHDQMVVKTL